MLGYYRDYRTMENIAFDYGVHKQRICEAIAWVEETERPKKDNANLIQVNINATLSKSN